MKVGFSRRAFTLLEILAVTTLLTIMIGTATIGMQGISDESELHATVNQIGSVLHLATCEANYIGKPCVLRFDPRGVVLRKPTLVDDRWQWSNQFRIDLPRKVRIMDVLRTGKKRNQTLQKNTWDIAIRPGNLNLQVSLLIQHKHGQKVSAMIDGYTGSSKIEFLSNDF